MNSLMSRQNPKLLSTKSDKLVDMHYRIFLFFLLPWTACLCQKNNDKLLVAKLDSLINNQFNEYGPGGSLFIEKSGDILYSRSFGLSDIVSKKRFTPKTVSNIGSITKTFVAYAILILQKQGKLSLEDSIIKYFPDFKNKEIARQVKIKHLLTHTSGLPDNREVDKDSAFYLTANDEQNFAPLQQTDSLEFEPGTKWKYSNPAFNGLALIIEKVSGMKWQSFIEEYIFRPAGMSHSKITDGAFPKKGVAHGYREIRGHFEEYDYGEYPTFTAAGNGGVWSSIEDLGKYVLAMKNCAFLDCNTIAFSQNVWHPTNWHGEQPPFMGFSWFIGEPTDEFKDKVVQHSGGQAGFHAHLYMIPEPGITIIWLTNNNLSLTPLIMKPLIELGYIK
jgi:CubicO group peptidase (beta-lactamase class C family)